MALAFHPHRDLISQSVAHIKNSAKVESSLGYQTAERESLEGKFRFRLFCCVSSLLNVKAFASVVKKKMDTIELRGEDGDESFSYFIWRMNN